MAKATKKSKFLCLNGPYEGMNLFLTTPSTLVFTVKARTGRYIDTGNHKLIWEEY